MITPLRFLHVKLEGNMSKKADEKKIDTLERGLRNLSEHDNLPDRLLKIEKDIRNLEMHHWINFTLFLISCFVLLTIWGMLL